MYVIGNNLQLHALYPFLYALHTIHFLNFLINLTSLIHFKLDLNLCIAFLSFADLDNPENNFNSSLIAFELPVVKVSFEGAGGSLFGSGTTST